MGDLTNKPTIVLVTKLQLALKLGVTVRSVNRMIDQGELPRPFHIGKTAYWNRSTLVAFLERKEKQEREPPHP